MLGPGGSSMNHKTFGNMIHPKAGCRWLLGDDIGIHLISGIDSALYFWSSTALFVVICTLPPGMGW